MVDLGNRLDWVLGLRVRKASWLVCLIIGGYHISEWDVLAPGFPLRGDNGYQTTSVSTFPKCAISYNAVA